MRLADQLGTASQQIDSRILDLVEDVEVRDFTQAIKSGGPLSNCICVGEDVSVTDFFFHLQERGLTNLVQKKHDYYTYNLLFQAIIFRYPDIFLKSPMTLITRNKDLGTHHLRIPFNTTGDKERIDDLSEAFVMRNSKNPTVLQNMRVIISEFFSNALFSAPTDPNGSYLFDKKPRNQRVEYPEGYEAEFMLSFNQEIFAIACRDPFGSVSRVRVTKRLHQVFDDQRLARVENAEDETLGSGLGLKMVIENSIGFGMVVNQGRETLVYATLPVGSANRKVARIPKNLCFKFY
jgi:hypothetical protein